MKITANIEKLGDGTIPFWSIDSLFFSETLTEDQEEWVRAIIEETTTEWRSDQYFKKYFFPRGKGLRVQETIENFQNISMDIVLHFGDTESPDEFVPQDADNIYYGGK